MRAKQFTSKVYEAFGDGDVANAVVAEVIKLIGEGHTEVSPDVITTKVSAALGRPFMLKDLVAANNSSPELQHYIDSINPSKIKFSTDILTVKNQDPVKTKEKAEAGVASMASRAASRPRLGESVNEGWGRGNDRVSLPDEPANYYHGTGQLYKEYQELFDKLVPASGAADTIEGEVLRAASKIVYRHYNDGDEFNQASFDQLKPYIGHVTSYDDLAHKATMFALAAEGEYHPNTGWDCLDVMEYGPEEDDEDDGYDDYAEYPDDDEDLDEARADQVYTVNIIKRSSFGGEGRTRTTSGTIPELLEYFGYTLEVGKSYERERGRYKINMTPKNINSLVDNLNKAASNGARNGHSSTYYEVAETEQVAEDSDERLELGTYRSDWLEFETAYDEAAQVFHMMNDDDIPDAFKPLEDVLDPEVVDALDYGLMGGDETLFKDKLIQALEIAQRKHGTEPRAALHGAVYALGRAARRYSKMSEGWGGSPGAPDDRPRRERDPDAEYDAMRTAKADDEAIAAQAKRPQTKVYTLTGRGPNMEPNYKFPGEYATQDEADAARAKLMADPSTPNPRMIGISTRTKYLEDSVTPLRDLEDYHAKKKALQDIQVDPDTAKDPELNLAVMRRLAGLEKQRSELK